MNSNSSESQGATSVVSSIDKQQACQQFKLLGYEPGDNIYFRGFYDSNDPRKANDQGVKADSPDWKRFEKWQRDARGVYFVINGGGHKNDEVHEGRAIFYEHDDLPKEQQLTLYQVLGLPEPTFQVDTGGKSIHSYWVFDKPIPISDWKELQVDLLEFADADRSIKNPARVMRLAGAIHPATGQRCNLVASSGKKYSFEELRSLIPKPQPKPQAQRPQQNSGSNYPTEKSLAAFLTIEDRGLVEKGVTQGSRNPNGAKLARNLIGTANALQNLGIHYTDSPRQLFDDYCQRCNPPIDSREADQIWKSAENSNPTATLSDDYLRNIASGRTVERRSVFDSVSAQGEGDLDPLRLEIKRYLAENDLFKQVRLRSEICSQYRLTKADFESLAATLGQAQVSQPTKCYKGKDFLFLETEGLAWIFPGLIPARGVTLLYSLPGGMKTTLGVDAVCSFLWDEEFLGDRPNVRGKALIVSSDELPTFTQDKLINRGAPQTEDWEVLTDWDVSQWDILENRIEALRPKFILIDSLTAVHFSDPSFDENSPKAAKFIKKLEALCQKYDCAVLLIHHSGKSEGNKGVAAARGSTALTGAASTCISLNPTSDDTTKLLKIDKIRGARNRKFKIQLDSETGRFEVREESSEEELDKSLTERVADILKHAQKLEIVEICDLLGLVGDKSDKDSIRKTLDRLREKGQCDRRPSRVNPRSHVWYWKADKVVSENVSIVVSITETLTEQESQPIYADNFDLERGGEGMDENTKKYGDPPPPPCVSKSVSIKSLEPIPSNGYSNADNNADNSKNDADNQVLEALSALQMAAMNDDKNDFNRLYENFSRETLAEASRLLGSENYKKISSWVKERNGTEEVEAKPSPFNPGDQVEDKYSENQFFIVDDDGETSQLKTLNGTLLKSRTPSCNLKLVEQQQLALDINISSADAGWNERGH